MLGVIVNDRRSASDFVPNLLESCSHLLYAFHVLHIHGLPSVSLQDVFRSTVLFVRLRAIRLLLGSGWGPVRRVPQAVQNGVILIIFSLLAYLTISSAVADRPRDASCLFVVSCGITIPPAPFFKNICYFGFRFSAAYNNKFC